jgi:hypothetical protein
MQNSPKYLSVLALASVLLMGAGCTSSSDAETDSTLSDSSYTTDAEETSTLSLDVPTAWPYDVPVYEGYISDIGTDATSAWATITTPDDPQMVAVWYMSELGYKSWMNVSDEEEDGVRTMLYTKEDETLGVAIAETTNGTLISISNQYGY